MNAAYADFSLMPSKTSIEQLCPRSTGLFTDVILNNEDGYFTVNVEGDGAKWATSIPSGFILKSGERKTIYTYVTPNRDVSPGNYFVNTVVSTQGETKKTTHNFVVKDCYITGLSFKQTSKVACPGDKGVMYELTLSNSGEYRENYVLSAKGDATLSNEVVSLDPGETQSIFAYVDVDDDEKGSKEFNVVAKTSDDKIIEAQGAVLNIDRCYDYDVFPEKNSFNICDGDNAVSPMTVNNLGSVSNVYSFLLDGPEWASLEKNGIELNKGSNGVVNLQLNPPYGLDGNFIVIIETIPKNGIDVIEDTYTVNVRKCNNVDVDIIENDEVICKGETLSYDSVVYNNGEVNNQFDVSLNAPEWVGLSENRVNLVAGEKKTVLINVDDAVVGDYLIGMNVDAVDGAVSASDDLKLKVLPFEECYNVELKMSDREVIYYDDSASIPIAIRNKGYRPAEYDISLSGDGVNFVQLNPSSLIIDPDKSDVVSMYVAPSAQVLGEYDINVDVSVEGSAILASKRIDLKVTDDKDEATIGRGFIERYIDNIRTYISNLINRIRERFSRKEVVEERPEILEEPVAEEIVIEEPVVEEVVPVVEEVVIEEPVVEEIETLQFVTMANKVMGVGDKFRFDIENGEHTVELIDLEGGKIVLRFTSEPLDVEFNIDDVKNIDFGVDGVDDLKVTFNGIRNGKADITFELIPKSRLKAFYNEIEEFVPYIAGGVIIALLLILFIHFKVYKKIIDFFEEDFDDLDEIEDIKKEVKSKRRKNRKGKK